MRKFTRIETAQRAADALQGVVAVKVIDCSAGKHWWAIRHEDERDGVYL